MPEIEDALRTYYDGEMAARAVRPLGAEREAAVAGFVELCQREALSSVVEVGCGAGRDGVVLQAAGLAYRGLDASSSSVEICRGLGLDAVLGSALSLPFADDEFDAGWSMSTLMHLPGDGLALALGELGRVVRAGGVVEIGVWGSAHDREWTDEHGRYFRNRTDDELRSMLDVVGDVVDFATWTHYDNFGHYQWARVKVR